MITTILSGVKCYLWSKETLILSFHIELYFVGLLFTSYKQFFIFVTEGVKTQKREDVKTPLVVGGIKIIYCPNFQLFYKMSLECIISWRKCAPRICFCARQLLHTTSTAWKQRIILKNISGSTKGRCQKHPEGGGAHNGAAFGRKCVLPPFFSSPKYTPPIFSFS